MTAGAGSKGSNSGSGSGSGRYRRRGEGTVYWHAPTGRYAAQLSAGTDATGRRRRYTVYGATVEECLAARDELKRALRLGRLPDPRREAERLSLAEWLAQWLETQTTRRPATVAIYERAIRLHLVPAIGHLRLAQLRPSDIARLTAQLQAKPATRILRRASSIQSRPGRATLSARSVQITLGVLRQALDQAEADGLIDRNPARSPSVRPPPVHTRPPRPLEPAEVAAFLCAAQQDRLKALWILAVYHGLRRGELLGLRWSDLRWQTGELLIRRQLVGIVVHPNGTHEPVLAELKTEASRRDLVLSPTALAALRSHWQRQLAESQAAGELWEPHELVFCTRLGRPLHARTVERLFKRVLRTAGLPEDIHLHDLRHTTGTHLAAAGVDLATIASLLGHRDKAFTARTYLHALRDARRTAAEALDRLLMGWTEGTEGTEGTE